VICNVSSAESFSLGGLDIVSSAIYGVEINASTTKSPSNIIKVENETIANESKIDF
jgi:hypothetical protein